MAQYPNSGAGNGGRNPWQGYGVPQFQGPYDAQQPDQQQMYGYGEAGQYSMSYGALPYQPMAPTGSQRIAAVRRPYLLALFVFPFQSLRMFILPAPGTFAGEKDRAGWGLIWTILLGLVAVAGLLVFMWGRMPGLTLAIQNISAGRVIPQPLPQGLCLGLALATPLIFLLLMGVMHLFAKKLDGQGSYRAQSYTALLIVMPLAVLLLVAAFALSALPVLSGSLHLVFAFVLLALFLYGVLLHIFAVMAVQGIGVGKAFLVVLGMVVILLVILVMLALLVLAAGGDSSSSSSSSSGSNSKSNSGSKGSGGRSGGSQSGSGNAAQNLGIASAAAASAPRQVPVGHESGSTEQKSPFDDLDFGGEGHERRPAASGLVMAFCPTCGLRQPVPAYQARMGVICPRCGGQMTA